jgi:histidinol-phosphate phosphatase family protein
MRDWRSKIRNRYDSAVLIDRDGVVNVDTHYPHDAKKLQMVPEAIVGMKILAKLPAHIIVISNQGGIAQARFTVKQMSEFNKAIRSCIENEGGHIDAFYYCPHEEEKNLPEGVAPCKCSKPRPGMLLEAADDFGFDLAKSFMIGDRITDMKAGRAASCTTIKVIPANIGQDAGETGSMESEFIDYSVGELDDAARVIQGIIANENS